MLWVSIMQRDHIYTQNHGDSSRCVMEETTFLHNYLHQPFFDICCHSLHTNTNFLFNVYIVHRICSVWIFKHQNYYILNAKSSEEKHVSIMFCY